MHKDLTPYMHSEIKGRAVTYLLYSHFWILSENSTTPSGNECCYLWKIAAILTRVAAGRRGVRSARYARAQSSRT